jgi:hypothetical protein
MSSAAGAGQAVHFDATEVTEVVTLSPAQSAEGSRGIESRGMGTVPL